MNSNYCQVIPGSFKPISNDRKGWICPKCNKGISPDLQVCHCSDTSTTTTTVYPGPSNPIYTNS